MIWSSSHQLRERPTEQKGFGMHAHVYCVAPTAKAIFFVGPLEFLCRGSC